MLLNSDVLEEHRTVDAAQILCDEIGVVCSAVILLGKIQQAAFPIPGAPGLEVLSLAAREHVSMPEVRYKVRSPIACKGINEVSETLKL